VRRSVDSRITEVTRNLATGGKKKLLPLLVIKILFYCV